MDCTHLENTLFTDKWLCIVNLSLRNNSSAIDHSEKIQNIDHYIYQHDVSWLPKQIIHYNHRHLWIAEISEIISVENLPILRLTINMFI